jgi:hypothetical protein
MKRLHVRIFEVSVHDEKECSNQNATNHHCDAGTTHNDAPQLPPLWLSVKRRNNNQIHHKRRAEALRGGQVQAQS